MFSAITSSGFKFSTRFLNGKYLPVQVLKTDEKGKVFKGVYFKRIMNAHWCLIKQGVAGSCTDDQGRDMTNRILWQKYLCEELAPLIPVPRLIDCFYQNGDQYLVTEFIDGKSLHEWMESDNKTQEQLIRYLLDLAKSLSELHALGYVHRDLNPANFLVNEKDRVFLIDLEMCYSISGREPNPPFVWGTAGFMSPEQIANEEPSVEQDIFGLGVLMIYTMTGVGPQEAGLLNEPITDLLKRCTGSERFTDLLISCLDFDPGKRPKLAAIIQELKSYSSFLSGGS
jgi:serine/threonine protein kinase